jgi:hypothetical protein
MDLARARFLLNFFSKWLVLCASLQNLEAWVSAALVVLTVSIIKC